jgi:hypothetical protein
MRRVEDPAWGAFLMSVSDQPRFGLAGALGPIISAFLGPMAWLIVALGTVVLLIHKLLGRRTVDAISEHRVVLRKRWSFGFVPWSELRFARFDGGIELGDHRGREVERVALQARCATGTRLRSSTWPASRRGRRPLRGEDPSHVHR